MGKLVRRWPFTGIKAWSSLSHWLFVLGRGPFEELQQERPSRAFWFLLSSRWC